MQDNWKQNKKILGQKAIEIEESSISFIILGSVTLLLLYCKYEANIYLEFIAIAVPIMLYCLIQVLMKVMFIF